MFNLLIDPIVPIESAGSRESLTLPGLFNRLSRDDVGGFPGLTAHQAQAWYQFLAQVGALALLNGGISKVPDDPDVWRELLTGLTADCADAAWSLVVDDATLPAFLQPPTEVIGKFRPAASTPDTLDVLVTAKNHDRKREQAVRSPPHRWLYALVTLQTAQGYSGRGNPGIARMNGGMSSRVLVDRRPDRRWGRRVDRAIRMLLARRADLLQGVGDDLYRSTGGLALTWLRPWDTDTPLTMTDLDPFFIEVCRRVRLTATEDGPITALMRPAKQARTHAAALKGNVGDPWVPINLSETEPTALTVSRNGFDYRLAQRILFDNSAFRQPLALKELPGERGRDSEIHMAVLVRGQGKTEGLHERIIPLPGSVVAHLPLDADEDAAAELMLADLSKRMVNMASAARKVLRQAVLVYLQGPEDPNFQKPDAASSLDRYDRTIDEQFFEYLFRAADTGSDDANRQWQRFLADEAFRLARSVWRTMAAPSARREKARAASEAVLFGGLRKHLPEAYPASKEAV